MNTTFQEVYNVFLSNITSYEFLDLTEEELEIDLELHLKKAFSKCVTFKNIKLDYNLKEFNRELTYLEIDIIAKWMVVDWLMPQINTLTLLKQNISSKDFQMYSQANHLKQLLELKKELESDVQYWMNRYSWVSR